MQTTSDSSRRNTIPFEVELVRCCARAVMDEPNARRTAELLQTQLDWAELPRFATRHRVLPLLYSHLNVIAPRCVTAELRERAQACTQRNLALTAELARLHELFTREGIRVAPYKGPVLALTAYGNLALRQFFDLDLLVGRGDMTRARSLLTSNRYRPHLSLTAEQEERLLRSECELAFRREDDQFEVELHSALAPRYFSCELDTEGMWTRMECVALGGATMRTLGREDTLLALCVHGAKHLWLQLGWVCDVAELIRATPQMDWDALRQRAKAAGCERMVSVGLRLAEELLGAGVPAFANDPRAQALATVVRQQLFAGAAGSPRLFERSPEQPFEARVLFHPFHVQVREQWRDRVRYLLRLGFTPGVADYRVARLPSCFFFLYYLIRPVRLAVKYLRRMIDNAL